MTVLEKSHSNQLKLVTQKPQVLQGQIDKVLVVANDSSHGEIGRFQCSRLEVVSLLDMGSMSIGCLWVKKKSRLGGKKGSEEEIGGKL